MKRNCEATAADFISLNYFIKKITIERNPRSENKEKFKKKNLVL